MLHIINVVVVVVVVVVFSFAETYHSSTNSINIKLMTTNS